MVTKYNFGSDYSISRIIKGGWQLAGGHGLINRNQAIKDMFAYVESGITTFDCADIYTGVEEMIGDFYKKYSETYGKNDLIKVHTKFVPDISILPTISKHYVESIIDRSLQLLCVEQLHLVQFHWWDFSIDGYVETAGYLRELQQKGKIRNIGVTNFDVNHLKEIVDSGVKILTNQVQYSILDLRPEHGMTDFCLKNNIKLLCYGTVAGGFLSERYLGVKEPEVLLENRSLTKYKLIIDELGGWDKFQDILTILLIIAKKYNVSLTNVATRYVLEKDLVAGIIIGARNSNHLKNNLELFHFALDKEDHRLISNVLKNNREVKGDIYSLERIKGGKHASIMKYNLNKVINR
jgi:aryl-alcohol dehydrogenase-like predicted oxidoreductase